MEQEERNALKFHTFFQEMPCSAVTVHSKGKTKTSKECSVPGSGYARAGSEAALMFYKTVWSITSKIQTVKMALEKNYCF